MCMREGEEGEGGLAITKKSVPTKTHKVDL